MDMYWRARDRKTGECCPHHHHSPQSAGRCALRFGDDGVIERSDNDALKPCKKDNKDWKYRKNMRKIAQLEQDDGIL